MNFQQGERLRIRIIGAQGQLFDQPFWFTVTGTMSVEDVALQFAQTIQPGMFVSIKTKSEAWLFQKETHAGHTSVRRARKLPTARYRESSGAREAKRPRITTVTYSMPIYWASYLINGDASGIDDDDIAQADAAIEDIGLGAPVDVGESEFKSRGDYGKLAGDYADYTFIEQHGKTREHRVADFNTLDDLIDHAARDLGATHVVVDSTGTMAWLYFPRKDGKYDEARVRRTGGYWHAEGPGSRDTVPRLSNGANTIEQYLERRKRGGTGTVIPKRATEARRRGGHLPQRYKHSSSTLAPDMAFKLADALAQRLDGTKPKMIEGGFRYSDRNVSAQFTTYSPEHGQKVVVVASVFEDGTTALNFFSDEGLSGTATFENISSFTYNGADLPEMEKDVRWVWATVDGYAASWQQDDVDESRRVKTNPRRSAHHKP